MKKVIDVRTDFSVLRECDDWVVVGKPAPLVVHPSGEKVEPSLVTELEGWYRERGVAVPELCLVNRLDRETSGCVLVGKSRRAGRIFGKAMQRREIGKVYEEIVWGWPEWERRVLEAPFLRMGEVEESAVWVRQAVHEEGRECVTEFEVVRRFEKGGERFAVVGCRSRTGRTHQIQAHLEYVGHAIVGDKIYGGDGSAYFEFIEKGWTEELRERLWMDQQALHGCGMDFSWEGERVEVECAWPAELVDFLKDC
nr:ribosomal large subunit pseudouridine synthase D-like [Nerophis lumbriciformis]